MADTTKVTFTRPVRVNKKRYAKGASDAIDATIAEQLVELGAATVIAAKEETVAKKDKGGKGDENDNVDKTGKKD